MSILDVATSDHEVQNVEDRPWREVSDVGVAAARIEWAGAAREMLLGAARKYQALVQLKDLAAGVQELTRIQTKQATRLWIGGVLAEVYAENLRRGEPMLSSLCVNPDESVFDGYAVIVGAATGETPADADAHASHERLAAHRYFEAAGLPADGGSAMIPLKLGAARARARKAAIAERPIKKCPICNLQTPANGICDTCD
ncbi:hypothetical protein HPO96_09005 [Kribbella sandramycini]|uniref:Uncharacterized protein n=1 Tax=Kribbella sandramycini TaxID=60450 RepID=A0A7Y4NXZ6_9ACTN|nr:hypothetical protein [Kribbella sandramycini]MBB6569791.1 hypothetical protein [Kribbella sandramycini]NOL40382.1 hypothetical protein [Kribbella sandramycini]